MQLLGVPGRLQVNSIYLHTIYQLSSTDGLILRQSPCSSPTSHCNESLLQGIKQGSLLLLQIFPQTGKEKRSISSLRTVLVSSEGASWLFAYSIRKQDQLIAQDGHSKMLMFPFILPHLFHALSHNEGTCESRQVSLVVRGPAWASEHSPWQKQKSWRIWMALWSGKRPQMFTSRSLLENWGALLLATLKWTLPDYCLRSCRS